VVFKLSSFSDKEKLEEDKRFLWGAPTVDNANYLWIELFYAALNDNGRAGFVMANSASDARGSELEIRRQLIETGAVDAMVAVGSNFFYTVTLPCTLWFLDKGKATGTSKDRVLFVDARHIYCQVDRARREFSEEQVEFLANIVRLYRGEPVETVKGSGELVAENFPNGVYRDVAGLCRVATVAEIEGQGWSLNPGRYVGVAERVEDEDFDFAERLEELHEELEVLNGESRVLEERISENVGQLLSF
jgi:type I restriction enzyme M protein